MSLRIVGVICPNCGDDWESQIIGFYEDKEGNLTGQKLRCKACRYSWDSDKWGIPMERNTANDVRD